jgi:hypothetical protein
MNSDQTTKDKEFVEAVLLKLETIYGKNAKNYASLIETVRTMKGSDSLFKEALYFSDNRIPDFIVELYFASYFHNRNYSVEIVSRSDQEKTPDLLISNETLRGYVEIKHIRKKHEGPKSLIPGESTKMKILEKYGDPVRDERYCRDKILEGFHQIQSYSGLKNTDVMVVAIWNSDEDLDELDLKFTISNLIEERNEFENIPNQKWVVFGNPWYSLRENTQFHIFQF